MSASLLPCGLPRPAAGVSQQCALSTSERTDPCWGDSWPVAGTARAQGQYSSPLYPSRVARAVHTLCKIQTSSLRSLCVCTHACVCVLNSWNEPVWDDQETQMESQICLLATPEAKHITSPGFWAPI